MLICVQIDEIPEVACQGDLPAAFQFALGLRGAGIMGTCKYTVIFEVLYPHFIIFSQINHIPQRCCNLHFVLQKKGVVSNIYKNMSFLLPCSSTLKQDLVTLNETTENFSHFINSSLGQCQSSIFRETQCSYLQNKDTHIQALLWPPKLL